MTTRTRTDRIRIQLPRTATATVESRTLRLPCASVFAFEELRARIGAGLEGDFANECSSSSCGGGCHHVDPFSGPQ